MGIVDSLDRAGVDASLESSSEASGLSVKLKVLIRTLIHRSSNSYPSIRLEYEALEILKKRFGIPALRERNARFVRYQNKVQWQLNAMEMKILTHIQNEPVCPSAIR